MIETHRRYFLAALNSRWVYGKIPLLHALIFMFELAAASLLAQRFNAYHAERPILTTMITNAILGGVADTTAQVITAVRARRKRLANGQTNKDEDLVAIEVHQYDMEKRWPANEMRPAPGDFPPPFDFERLTRFMSYGFLMAPVQYKWYGFLSSVFPITKASGASSAFKRVAFDQLIFAPVSLAGFFVFMTVAEGGGRRAVGRKFQDVYIPALKANYLLWPAVQLINFRFMPLQFQIPFISTMGIAWTAYLSLTNESGG